jgi:Zn finger protein HypA/HybF involved in hydrogenase expression
MPGVKKLQKSAVLDEIRTRDQREYPVVTVSEVAEWFDDVTRRTVERRMTELAEDGKLESRQQAKIGIYWTPGVIACPHCGADTERDPTYENGIECVQCDAIFLEIATDKEVTQAGSSFFKGCKFVVWWTSLPALARRVIGWYARRNIDDPEIESYTPETDTEVDREVLDFES